MSPLAVVAALWDDVLALVPAAGGGVLLAAMPPGALSGLTGSDDGDGDGGDAVPFRPPQSPRDVGGRGGGGDQSDGEPGPPDRDAGAADPAARDRDGQVEAEGTGGVFRTGRWDAALAGGLLVGAAGVLLGNATVLLAAAVPFTYAAYGFATAAPTLDVAVERTVSADHPRPGQPVRVDLRVTNEGTTPLPDLRVVDGVPRSLPVTAGSPRGCATLAPGESTVVSYELPGRRGEHAFEPVTLLARGVGESTERRETRAVGTTIVCRGGGEELPLRQQTAGYAGEVPTDSGGEGVEFYSVRNYTPGDPMSRIDWNRFAGTGELTTVEFRQTRAATVVLVVDARADCRRARRVDEPDAVEFGEYAAERLARSLLGGTNSVGLALFGEGEYLPPATGRAQALRVEQLIAGDTPTTARTIAARASVSRLRRHLPEESQVVFVSPLLDDEAVDVARRLEAYGHAATVVSPDVTGESPGGRVERLQRLRRLRELRSGTIRVVDWSPDEPLAVAADRAAGRWSA